MNARTEGSGLLANVSQAIRQEIHRFESVHPVIYNLYDLIENIPNQRLRNEIRDHVINIEGQYSPVMGLSPTTSCIIIYRVCPQYRLRPTQQHTIGSFSINGSSIYSTPTVSDVRRS